MCTWLHQTKVLINNLLFLFLLIRSTIPSASSAASTLQPVMVQPHPPAASAAGTTVTLYELLEEVRIDESKLAVRCTESGLDYIATKISPKDWGTYARELDIPENTLDDIKEDTDRAKEQRFSGLIAWKKRLAFKAKYLVLVNLFLKKNNAQLAESVCIYVRDNSR